MDPGEGFDKVVTSAGAATVVKNIELTINQAAVVMDGGTTRPIRRSEIVQALYIMAAAIPQDSIQPGVPNPL